LGVYKFLCYISLCTYILYLKIANRKCVMSWWLSIPEVLALRNYTSFAKRQFWFYTNLNGGMLWCSWLRYCATSRRVTESIPDGDNGICHWHLLLAPLWSWGRLSLKQKWVPGIFPISEYDWQPYSLQVPSFLKSRSLSLLEPSRPV